jgi:hypothetical protein
MVTQTRSYACTVETKPDETQDVAATGTSSWSDWYPDASDVCLGQEFYRHSDLTCDGDGSWIYTDTDPNPQYGTGDPCYPQGEGEDLTDDTTNCLETEWTEWLPELNEYCKTETVLQYRYGLTCNGMQTREVNGTKIC